MLEAEAALDELRVLRFDASLARARWRNDSSSGCWLGALRTKQVVIGDRIPVRQRARRRRRAAAPCRRARCGFAGGGRAAAALRRRARQLDARARGARRGPARGGEGAARPRLPDQRPRDRGPEARPEARISDREPAAAPPRVAGRRHLCRARVRCRARIACPGVASVGTRPTVGGVGMAARSAPVRLRAAICTASGSAWTSSRGCATKCIIRTLRR